MGDPIAWLVVAAFAAMTVTMSVYCHCHAQSSDVGMLPVQAVLLCYCWQVVGMLPSNGGLLLYLAYYIASFHFPGAFQNNVTFHNNHP